MLRAERGQRVLLPTIVLVVAVLLAACGGSHEVTYRCSGSADEVAVTYTGEDGGTVEEEASLPWEVTVVIKSNDLSTDLDAENLGDSGDISCEVLVDGEQMLEASGEESLSISGTYTVEGNTTTTSYRGGGVSRPTPTAVPTEQPAIGGTMNLRLSNRGPVNVCGLYLTPSDADSWGQNQFAAGTVVAPGEEFTLTDVPVGIYDVKVETCASEIIAWIMRADFSREGDANFEVTGEPMLLVTNRTSQPICFIGTRPAGADGWFRNLLSEGQTIAPGAQLRVWAPAGQHDLRADTCSGEGVVLEGMTITGQHTWDIVE